MNSKELPDDFLKSAEDILYEKRLRKRSNSLTPPPTMSDATPLRIVLLGKSVSANSEVGNLILGRSAFDRKAPLDVVERVGGRLKHRQVILINSPQLLHTNISDHQITQMVRECVSLSDPGPHVVLLLLQPEQCSAEDQERVEKLLDYFSKRLLQHSIVITSQEPTKSNIILQNIIHKCSNRHLSLQGCSSTDRLLQALEDIEESNEGRHLLCYQHEATPYGERMNVVVCGCDGSLKSSISELIQQQTHRRSESVRTDMDLHDRPINLQTLPALFNTNLSEDEKMRRALRCVSLCDPGVHVFLLIISDADLNNQDRAEMEEILRIFSSRINKHLMILIKRKTAELSEETHAVIKSFGGRHHFFGPKTQVSTLMKSIEQLLEENRGDFFSTETFLEKQMKTTMKYEDIKENPKSLETLLLSQDDEDELRIVLLGKTGSGKSATGNTILGKAVFTAEEESFESVTKESQRETSEVNGRQVTVIDTPGLFDTELSSDEIQREIRNCISMILPGPHVFLLLIPLGRFAKEVETSAVKVLQEMFGENSLRYTMVLFTRGDSLRNKNIQQCLGKPGSMIRRLIEACGERFHVFNNNQTGDRTQVSELLDKIDNMVKANGGRFYTCKMFRQIERENMKSLMDRFREAEQEKKKLEREKDRMKMMMEEERQNLKKEEIHQKEKHEQMKRECETLRHKIEKIRYEMEKIKTEKDNLRTEYETETERLMNRMEERKKREEEYKEREEQYKTQIKENEEKETEMKEKMKRECETLRQEMEEMRKEKEKIKTEKDNLRTEHETQTERLMNRMEKERKKREEEYKEREEQYKTQIKENEEKEREMKEKMKREQETFKQEIEEKRKEKEKIKTEKDNLRTEHETETERLKNRMEKERKEYKEREELYKTEIKEKEREMKEERKIEHETFKLQTAEIRKEYENKLEDERKYREKDINRREEEDQKRREKEKQIYDDQIQRLKSEIEVIIREKDRTEKERREQLEDLQKRLKDERNTREDLQKTFEDLQLILQQLKQYEDAVQSRRQKSADITVQIICQKLKEPIEQSIYRKTARDLADEMRSNCESVNGNIANLEKHILKALVEENNFDKYMNYIHNPRDHIKEFIRDMVSRYINDKFSISVLPKMKENIKLQQQKIMKAAHESTEHVLVNRGDVDWWLKSFKQQLSDQLIFSEEDLSGVKHDDVSDFKLLEDVIRQALTDVMSDISSRFNIKSFPVKLDPKFRPDELLIDHFSQCCWVQCPFCKAICTNNTENHHENHCTPFHRVGVVNEQTNQGTANLAITICPMAVYPKNLFLQITRRWNMPSGLSAHPYWKWFMCTFQEDLEKYYNGTFEGSDEIPDEWRKYSKQDAIESLDES